MVRAVDPFDGSGALSAAWTQIQGSMERESNAAVGASVSSVDCAYRRNDITAGADQEVVLIITNTDTGDYYYGAILRAATGGALTYYEIAVNTTESLLYRWNAGTPNLLDTGDGLSGTNRELRFRATGSGATVTLTVLLDGVGLGNIGTSGVVTDSTGSRLTSGQVGMGGFLRNDNTPGMGIQSFDGGDLASTATVTPSPAALTISGRAPATSAFANVRIREVLVNESGQVVGNAANITLLVWYGGICRGAPDVSLNGNASDANGTTSWSIATGTLAYNDPIFYVAQDSVSYSNYTCARMIPSYE